MKKAFTLVELLIVIALIAILSVAVLATINPIEQSNKAKDASVQNDAAEVMNSYERYYANAQAYPWMKYGPAGSKPTVEDAMLLRSDDIGFGICNAGDFLSPAATQASACSVTDAAPGLLISTDELKPAFVGKDAFGPVQSGVHVENGLWLFKDTGSGGSVYVCYIPKSKSSRESTTNKLFCLNNTVTPPTRSAVGIGNCAALATNDAGWGTPTLDGVAGMFKCVP